MREHPRPHLIPVSPGREATRPGTLGEHGDSSRPPKSERLDARCVPGEQQAEEARADLDMADAAALRIKCRPPGSRPQVKAEAVLVDQGSQDLAQFRLREARAGIVDQFTGPAPPGNPREPGRIRPNRVQAVEFAPGNRGGGCVAHHENTCRTDVYSLTTQDFSNYIATMDQDLNALEDRVRQVAALCQQLRAENSDLRQRMAQLSSQNKVLAEKIDGARIRLQGLLGQLPE